MGVLRFVGILLSSLSGVQVQVPLNAFVEGGVILERLFLGFQDFVIFYNGDLVLGPVRVYFLVGTVSQVGPWDLLIRTLESLPLGELRREAQGRSGVQQRGTFFDVIFER